MKLNNKGFAITAVLYGLLILFVVLVSSYLLVLSVKKKRVETLVNDIEDVFIEITGEPYLKVYITNLYNNYATSVSLMNDKQGQNGGNIRYYGNNPKNYIYFNCKIYPNHDCEKWRIIGIVDGKVKIVRDSSIGNLKWDDDSTDNNWNNATLQELLNDSYYNNQDTSYYNNSAESIRVNFATDGIGLKTGITRNMISTSNWYLGECSNEEKNPDTAYLCERDGTNKWSGKIALLYLSDYGYASDWLKISSHKLLTPSSNSQVWAVTDNGNISGNNAPYTLTSVSYGVVPTLYLNEDVKINGGNGSFNNPYKIKIGE